MENIQNNEAFKQLVNEAIEKCKKFLQEPYNFRNGMDLEREMRGNFSYYIIGFTDKCTGLDILTLLDSIGRTDAVQNSIISDITLMENKLIAYQANGYMNPETTSDKNIFNIVTTASTQQTQITNITFTNTIEQIKEMSGLSDQETEETIAKIEEIKAIIDQGGSKKTKWKKIKPILIWLADKSVDVGCALLPLILKIGEQA